MPSKAIPMKTIERLSLYRRILRELQAKGDEFIFSYQLAALTSGKAAQVRRDLMFLDILANPQKGYSITELITCINNLLDKKETQKMGIVGAGNMGRAFINFFKGRGRNLEIVAAFDIDKKKTNRVINGCRTYPLEKIQEIVKTLNITIGIITVPENDAQDVAELLIKAGIRAIINVAPVPIKSPATVHVENLDLTSFFEKTAYYAKMNTKPHTIDEA
jgi:redox-sensing transcriptional repressor